MAFITDIFVTQVIYRGKRYRVNAAYDTVLAFRKLLEDERLKPNDKVNQALKMLVKGSRLRIWSLTFKEKEELLNEIVVTQINLPERPKTGRSKQKLVDFDLDGEYIYASFKQNYGIDLIDEQGRLHWKKFIALFEGLSEGAKIKEIMRIRGMDIPEPTKYNQKQRQSIMELKSFYALPAMPKQGSSPDTLFAALEKMAE